MKRSILALGLAAMLLGAGACKKQVSDSAAIRSGILQHLNSVGTLNMSAMDMDIRSLSIQGNQAHAEVEFRPKTGGPPGSGMQVAYNLEKQGDAWVVEKTQPLGGMIQHPDPTQNPHKNQDVHSGMPNFNEILKTGTPAPGALPTGHPQVSSQPQNPPPDKQDPSSYPRLR
jgi:hypothetical protein